MENTRHAFAHPKNAPGPFFVENGECISCGMPEHVAPDLIGRAYDYDDESKGWHCYFKKQPETPDELKRAIRAVNESCCGAVWYSGTDEKIVWQCNTYPVNGQSTFLNSSRNSCRPITWEPDESFNYLFQSTDTSPDLIERIFDWIEKLISKVRQ